MKTILLCVLVLGIYGIDPPVWPDSFSITFVESYGNSSIHISGDMFYDYANSRSKVTRMNGQYDIVCGSVLPDVPNTPCSQLVRDGKRYVIFPERRQCCMCCVAEKGCGNLKPNWLEGATYSGKEVLLDQEFNKWELEGMELNQYYETEDNKRVMRRLVQGDFVTMDFIMNTYTIGAIPDEVFELPDYCTSTCSPASFCGNFQTTFETS